jgi:hypothetical protein
MTLLQIHVWWIIVIYSQFPNGQSIINIFRKLIHFYIFEIIIIS